MVADALSQLRSLFTAPSRMPDGKRPNDDADDFLDALDRFDQKQGGQNPSGLEVIDGLPVQPGPGTDDLSPIPEESGTGVDPRILLTQKLFVSLIGGGYPTIPTPERPEVPIIDRSMA